MNTFPSNSHFNRVEGGAIFLGILVCTASRHTPSLALTFAAKLDWQIFFGDVLKERVFVICTQNRHLREGSRIEPRRNHLENNRQERRRI